MQLHQPDEILRTSRLLLEPITPEHARPLYPLLQDERLYAFIPDDPPESVEALEKQYDSVLSRQSPDQSEIWLNWALKDKASRAYRGTVQATIQSKDKAYIAYQIFPEYWRNGYAKEACLRVLALLFDNYHVNKVTVLLDDRNTASAALVRSLRFTWKRKIKHADEFKGSVSNEDEFELTAQEFHRGNV